MRVDTFCKFLYGAISTLALATLIVLSPQVLAQPGVSEVLSVDFNITGTKIAAGHDSGLVEVINTSTGQILRSIQLSSGITDVAWSPHNSYLLAVVADDLDVRGTIHILHTVTGQEIVTLTGGGVIVSISWKPDGSRIAAVNGFELDPHANSYLTIWDTTTWKVSSDIYFANPVAGPPDWSPDGSRIAAGADENITIWDANTGTVVNTLIGHTGFVTALAWSPNGVRLASASSVVSGDDATIRVWDAVTGENLLVIPDSGAWNLAWSPDSTRLAASDLAYEVVSIWDATTGQLVDSITWADYVNDVAWSPDGNKLALGDDNGMVHIVPAPQGSRAPQSNLSTVQSIDWNNTGAKIAAGDDSGLVEIIDSSTGLILQSFQLPNSFLTDVAWSPQDSDLLAVADANPSTHTGTIHLLNTATGQEIMTLIAAGDGDQIRSISWKPDGSRIAGAVGSSAGPLFNRYVAIWDTVTGQQIGEILFHPDEILELDWSPDGSRIAAAGVHPNITLGDANTGAVVTTLIGHTAGVQAVAWSPDGSKLASSTIFEDRTIRVWDAATGQNTLVIPSGALDIAWSPDGTRIAAADLDPVVPIWDALTGQLSYSFMHTIEVYAVAWSPDGSKLAFGDAVGNVQIVPALGEPSRTATPTTPGQH